MELEDTRHTNTNIKNIPNRGKLDSPYLEHSPGEMKSVRVMESSNYRESLYLLREEIFAEFNFMIQREKFANFAGIPWSMECRKYRGI